MYYDWNKKASITFHFDALAHHQILQSLLLSYHYCQSPIYIIWTILSLGLLPHSCAFQQLLTGQHGLSFPKYDLWKEHFLLLHSFLGLPFFLEHKRRYLPNHSILSPSLHSLLYYISIYRKLLMSSFLSHILKVMLVLHRWIYVCVCLHMSVWSTGMCMGVIY